MGGFVQCCIGKAISITYSECVFLCVALGNQQAICTCHIVMCGLTGSIIFFQITIYNRHGFRKKEKSYQT